MEALVYKERGTRYKRADQSMTFDNAGKSYISKDALVISSASGEQCTVLGKLMEL